MKTSGLDIYGVDASVEQLAKARERGINVVCADVSGKLPFKDEYFNITYAGEVIEHVFDSRSFLSEMRRVTAPGGHVVITTPNFSRLDDRIKMLFGGTPRQLAPLHPYLYLHIRPFTYDLLRESLQVMGFTDVTLQTTSIRFDLFGKDIFLFSKTLTRLFPGFGSTLVVSARKH